MENLKVPRLRNPPPIEKKNAYDPTIVHRRKAYREDSFDLEAILEPNEY